MKEKKEKKVRDKEKLTRRVISSDNAPKAIGPYSQGVCTKKFVFFSGQIGLDAATGTLVEGGISQQTKQALKNIESLLVSEGLTIQNIVKTTVYLKNMDDFAAMNTEYATVFAFEPPARSCVAVCGLPLNALVEIEIIALR